MLLDVAVPPGGAPKPAGGGGSVLGVVCAPEAVAMAVAREWEGLNIGGVGWGERVPCGGGWCWSGGGGELTRCGAGCTGAAGGLAASGGPGLAPPPSTQRQPPAHTPHPCRLPAARPAGGGARAQRAVRRPPLLLPHILQVRAVLLLLLLVVVVVLVALQPSIVACCSLAGGAVGQWAARHVAGAGATREHPLAMSARPSLPLPARSGTVDPFHLGADLAADWRKQFRCGGAAGLLG